MLPCETGSLQAGQRWTQMFSAKCRSLALSYANSGKLRRQGPSLPLSSRSTVVYAEFSFLALLMLTKMRKTKRLLSVHPFDFELDSEYSAQSRRQSVQLSPAASSPDAFQVLGECWGVPFLSYSFSVLPLLPPPSTIRTFFQLVLRGNGANPNSP